MTWLVVGFACWGLVAFLVGHRIGVAEGRRQTAIACLRVAVAIRGQGGPGDVKASDILRAVAAGIESTPV